MDILYQYILCTAVFFFFTANTNHGLSMTSRFNTVQIKATFMSPDNNQKLQKQILKRRQSENILKNHHPDCSHQINETIADYVQKFVLFVGYARSGHSIIGSILDAHPNIVISHEYSILQQWITTSKQNKNRLFVFNGIYNNSCYNSKWGKRRPMALSKGYTLHIGGTWQGRYRDNHILIIGDKSGGMTASVYRTYHYNFPKIYHEFRDSLKVPILTIHAIRNPYDNIATMLLYNNKIKKTDVSHDQPYTNLVGLRKHIDSYFRKVQRVVKMINRLNLTVIEIHNDDLINDPTFVIKNLCKKLEITCSDGYINTCSNAVFNGISRTRYLVKWTPETVDSVREKSKKYFFLKNYTYFD
jgi:hypothetical protein